MSTIFAPPPATEPQSPVPQSLAPESPAVDPIAVISRPALVEERILATLRRFSPLALRVALAVTFVWFGALKVAGVPTLPAGLIAALIPFIDPALSVPVIGAAEVVLGLWLLTGWRQPLVLAALMVQQAGTLLVLVVRPDVAFQGGNFLALSVEGEFVVKNLVLLASLAVLAGLTTSRAMTGLPKLPELSGIRRRAR